MFPIPVQQKRVLSSEVRIGSPWALYPPINPMLLLEKGVGGEENRKGAT